MEFIGTKRLKEEICKRIESPQDYATRSLVLWGSTAHSIVERIVKECCLNFFKTFNPSEGCWYQYISPSNSFKLDNISIVEPADDFLSGNQYAIHRRGVVLADSWDLCYPADEIEDFIALVNTHNNSISHLPSEWVFVACVEPGKLDSLIPKAFNDNCDQYFFTPDFDEWTTYVIEHYGEAARIVVEYIKGDGNPLGIMDKWFKPIVADNGYSSQWTFFDAYYWNAIIEKISEDEDVNNLKIGRIRLYIQGITPNLKTTIGDDFCDYLAQKKSK